MRSSLFSFPLQTFLQCFLIWSHLITLFHDDCQEWLLFWVHYFLTQFVCTSVWLSRLCISAHGHWLSPSRHCCSRHCCLLLPLPLHIAHPPWFMVSFLLLIIPGPKKKKKAKNAVWNIKLKLFSSETLKQDFKKFKFMACTKKIIRVLEWIFFC